MHKLLTSTLLLAAPLAAYAQEWQSYDEQINQRMEINAQTVRKVDGKVFFDYRTKYKNESLSHLVRNIRAVVDCGTRQRADLESNGSYELRNTYAGTGHDKQVSAVCAMANKTSASAVVAAPAAARYSEEDARLLWEEALYTSNGMAYQYTVYTFGSKEAIEKCLAEYYQCYISNPRDGDKFRHHYGELPLWLRETVGGLQPGKYSAPLAKPTGNNWVLVRLDKSEPAELGANTPPRVWVEKFAPTALPSVTALRTDPELVMRRELNRIRNQDDLAKALAAGKIDKAHLDARLSSGTTLLIKAIGAKNIGFAKELLELGASPDQCSVAYCPLNWAALLEIAPAVRLLLDFKASPNGSPSGDTPLMAASAAANREIAQMLLDAGADPLASRVEDLGGIKMNRSVLFFAPSDKPEYLEWLTTVVNNALTKSGKYSWSAWVEQGKQRQAIVDGGSITLKRAPFKIIMKTNPDGASFRVLASEKAELLEWAKDARIRRQMASPMRVGATSPDSKFLVVRNADVKKGELDVNLSSSELGYEADPKAARGTKRQANGKGGSEDVYTVEEFITDSGEVPVAKFAGKEVAMVAGVLPDIGTGADFFKPARFRLVFQK